MYLQVPVFLIGMVVIMNTSVVGAYGFSFSCFMLHVDRFILQHLITFDLKMKFPLLKCFFSCGVAFCIELNVLLMILSWVWQEQCCHRRSEQALCEKACWLLISVAVLHVSNRSFCFLLYVFVVVSDGSLQMHKPLADLVEI